MASNNKAYLLMGGNIEPRLETFRQAILKLEKSNCDIISTSSVYESEAWGFESDQKFLNQLIVVETEFLPSELLHLILRIENELGRKRNKEASYTSRLIDIDILYFNEMVIRQSDLVIPHPRLHKRRFALLPLVEVAPEYLHPLLGKTNRELLEELDDPSEVHDYNEAKVCSNEV